MKIKLLMVLMFGLFLASCGQDEIEKKNEINVGTPETIDVFNSMTNASRDPAEGRSARWCCWGWLSASPCGYGFVIDISSMPVMATPQATYYYEIIQSGTTNQTTGWVANGGNTAWNLSPCTEYDIYVYHPDFGYPLILLNVMSDGCGNLFIC